MANGLVKRGNYKFQYYLGILGLHVTFWLCLTNKKKVEKCKSYLIITK